MSANPLEAASEAPATFEWHYPPIQDYGVIGDCRTIALVSRQGSVDWLCLPHFSAPSWFAALLDKDRGGRFAIRPREFIDSTRSYIEHTNVLQTRMRSPTGALLLTDCVSVAADDRIAELAPEHEMIRLIECTEGEVDVEVYFAPRPDYAR
ncbi:MAG TPA: trehalase-like domain-containing protein, partial [Burkholderiales bacterium]